jgi:hypothetical protein
MEDDQIPTQRVSEWQPTTDKVDLAHFSKLIEELGECVAAAARCIAQGIDEQEPKTGKPNRRWLEDEIADVEMMIEHMKRHFVLDRVRIADRKALKFAFKKTWFDDLKRQRTL